MCCEVTGTGTFNQPSYNQFVLESNCTFSQILRNSLIVFLRYCVPHILLSECRCTYTMCVCGLRMDSETTSLRDDWHDDRSFSE